MISVVVAKMMFFGDHSEKIEKILKCDDDMTLQQLIAHEELYHTTVPKNADFTISLTILRQRL